MLVGATTIRDGRASIRRAVGIEAGAMALLCGRRPEVGEGGREGKWEIH